MASERARERAVHRYYQSWLESSVGYRTASEKGEIASLDRFHLDGTALRASNDKTLIAFAQLGCLRLNAKRGIVTLLSTCRQYVLAEATKTTSLNHKHDNHNQDDELWFGNASLPRDQGISGDALTPGIYVATGPDGAQHSAPALVINDIALDSRYSHREYAGNGVNFYCGVPIVTASGYSIGVYTVTDDKPRDGLTPSELRFMQDMATVVMDHLETVKNDSARFRGERLVLGLGHFVQGDSTIYQDRSFTGSDSNGPGNPTIRMLPENVDETMIPFKGMTITDANPNFLKDYDEREKGKIVKPSDDVQTINTLKSVVHGSVKPRRDIPLDKKPQNEPDKSSTALILGNNDSAHASNSSQLQDIEQVFSRAANILRECAAADGVVFYDAVSKNFAKGPGTSNYADARESSGEAAFESRSSDENSSADRSSEYSGRSTSVSSGFSDNEQPLHVLSSRGKRSRMLGYSLDISSDSTATTNTIKTLGLSEQSLRRFIRRYPQGKMFYFSEDGEVSSDSDQSTSSSQRGRPAELDADGHYRERKSSKSSFSIAADLIQVVPGARSVIWLPLWDFAKQRWSAGSFLWSRHADRLLSAQEDLTYLRTFGSCIMGEIARLEAVSTDTARTTFIANISHELRSPLHGILGSIEFLQDTPLDAFQSSMATAVETCGKTLLDTVDHVLDYAKINNLSKNQSKPKKRGGRPPQSKSRTKEDTNLDCDFDLAVIVEEVIEAVYAGQTFRSAGKIDDTIVPGGNSKDRSPEATRTDIQRGSTKFSGAVRIGMEIQKRDSWWVHGQPGAIRRIVMNVFGNSLKYTDKGTIKISLRSDVPTVTSSRIFCITVADTGIGMAPEFLHNHAFTAFTQESPFSDGAGLGLNIVRQIVNSLGGKVEVSSEQGVGTEVKIWLTLPEAPKPITVDSDDLLGKVARKTLGQTFCLLDPKAGDNTKHEKAGDPGLMVESNFRELVQEWFGMRSMTSRSMNDVSADFFVYAEPPPIEYLLEHHGIHARNTEIPVIVMATNAFESSSLLANGIHQLTDIGRVVEVTAQPCGPQKLAKVLHRAMLRIAQLARDPQSQHTTDPAETDVVENSRISEPYLGDSDSHQDIPSRLERTHDDHSQPGESLPRTSKSTASKVKEESQGGPHSRVKLTDPPEAEDRASQDAHRTTLSPQISQSTRPTMSSRSTTSNSYTNLSGASVPSTPNPNAARVLLVDDNDINLNLLVAFMRRAKLPYEAAKDGLQALEAYKRAASGPGFAHVLMDISMPVMDGITSTTEIRRFEKREGLPSANIIALTGQASEATREEFFKAGGDEFLTKPVKFRDLMRILRS